MFFVTAVSFRFFHWRGQLKGFWASLQDARDSIETCVAVRQLGGPDYAVIEEIYVGETEARNDWWFEDNGLGGFSPCSSPIKRSSASAWAFR